MENEQEKKFLSLSDKIGISKSHLDAFVSKLVNLIEKDDYKKKCEQLLENKEKLEIINKNIKLIDDGYIYSVDNLNSYEDCFGFLVIFYKER